MCSIYRNVLENYSCPPNIEMSINRPLDDRQPKNLKLSLKSEFVEN